jgi:predicted peptidase
VPVVPALDKYIVSVVIAMLTAVADKLIKVSAVPIGYETEVAAGIVQVAAPPEPL